MAGKIDIKAHKSEIIKKFSNSASDTGSPEVQVALITDRINQLNHHFKSFPKDFHSKLGLLKLVGQRKRLLHYLRTTDAKRYTQLIKSLELRK